ncbi:MAG: histidinol dehydrogenase [Deltaproteobacteria bacterium]|jgi:histidinol dehydrogenase
MSTPIFRTTDDDFATTWTRLLARRDDADTSRVEESTRSIVDQVRFRKDAALVTLTARFDRRPDVTAADLEIDRDAMRAGYDRLDAELRGALERAAERIRRFHETQAAQLADARMEEPGATIELVVRPLARVGIYVPGGTATYPSTVLMNAIPAKVAGVDEVIMVSPAGGGEVADIVLAAAHLAGVDRLFTIGGAQAVAALAFGTETVPAVDKIVGPGNAWVAEAKRQVFGFVDIDEIAGPSEVLIVADDSADPEVLAADLLAQAEHDVRAAAILVTWDPRIAEQAAKAANRQVAELPRHEQASQALANRGGVILARDADEAYALMNAYAPEHLGLATADPRASLDRVENAGAVFLGHHAPEALGDYNAGSNHVLPTGGAARFGSPLSVHDFVRRMNVLDLDASALARLGPDAATLARAEGLEAHARAIEVRKGDEKR